jgi:hypothetical protein
VDPIIKAVQGKHLKEQSGCEYSQDIKAKGTNGSKTRNAREWEIIAPFGNHFLSLSFLFFYFSQKSQLQNILTFFHFLYYINHVLLLFK